MPKSFKISRSVLAFILVSIILLTGFNVYQRNVIEKQRDIIVDMFKQLIIDSINCGQNTSPDNQNRAQN